MDNNKRQLDGYTKDICDPFDLKEKIKSFGLVAAEADGHDVQAIYTALTSAKNAGKPTVVILNTDKGCGCCFAEIDGFNHYMVVTHDMAEEAVAEIDARLKKRYESID